MRYALVFFLTFIVGALASAKSATDQPEIRFVAEIDKSGYVGEALTYTIKLYSEASDISNVKVLSAPVFPQDVTVIQGIARDSQPAKVELKGKLYYCWTILRDFIVADKPGKYSIGKGRFAVYLPVVKEVQSGFWGRRRIIDYEEQIVECDGASFRIQDLPANKKTDTYIGCVGDFNIEAWFPPGKIYKDTEAYAIFKISGYGNLSGLKLPNIHKLFANGCRLKEIERDDRQTQKDGRLFSEITLTCRFIPEAEVFEISPLCLNFFNPSSKKFYDACSETLHWTGNKTEKGKTNRSNEAITI